MDIQTIPFMVFDRAHCLVGIDLIKRNLEFLSNLRPGYFHSMSQESLRNVQSSKDDRRVPDEYAAANMRILYGQALEAFFAVLFALLQAPLCIPAWLQYYRIEDLRNLTIIIKEARPFNFFKLRLEHFGWYALSKTLNLLPPDLPIYEECIGGFAKFWEVIALDFLNEKRRKEYNSLKHGFRVVHGGFRLSIGKEEHPGTPAPMENMVPLGGSPYGCTIYLPNDLKNRHKDVRAFALRKTSFNWDLRFLAARIELLTHSMSNVISFASGLNGKDVTNRLFYYPDDMECFSRALAPSVGITDFEMDYSYGDIQELSITPQMVHKSYDAKYFFEEKPADPDVL